MDGLLLIDKPAGITSHDVVDVVRKIARTRRVGHAGTLDPFATGLLILGINKGTKALTGLIGLDKTYEATARLGATSTTDDPEGEITVVGAGFKPAPDAIESAFNKFRGGYLQTAPAFSAKKIGGKKLYNLARTGNIEGIELPKKQVVIAELVSTNYTWPDLEFRVSCSSGTYIRALARDIGEALETGAYLTTLRRTMIGTHDVRDAIPLAELTTEMIHKRVIGI